MFISDQFAVEVSDAMGTILVIDDDELTRSLLRSFLESAGYEVIEAPDGSKGLEIYHEKGADLVITDIMMPGPSGIEVLESLRRKFDDVKIFAISAGSTGENGDMLRMANILGAERTFHKPLDKDRILEAIKEALR